MSLAGAAPALPERQWALGVQHGSNYGVVGGHVWRRVETHFDCCYVGKR